MTHNTDRFPVHLSTCKRNVYEVRQAQPRGGTVGTRNKVVTETAEFGEMVRRMVKAYRRRVAGDQAAGIVADIDQLANLAGLAADVDAAITEAVAGCRANGYSWADVGDVLGITRQAAYQRYGLRRGLSA
jgi:hypothetical protein